ncbi:MAG: hypothetical protein Q8Q90_02500 [bacterium]|nr:hypothetical protein [bacterium]
MSIQTLVVLCAGFIALGVASVTAPDNWSWVPIVGMGVLSGLSGVANAISEKKS